MKRLVIITTHPIQYNAPWFELLAQRKKLVMMVFYTWGQLEKNEKHDPGFGKNIEWDIPLLEGYDYKFVKNISKDPGSHHFQGIDNPTLIKEIEDWNPDTLLVFGWSFKSHLKVLRYFKGKIKILFRGDSNLLDEATGFSLNNIIRRIFLIWVYHNIDTALYVGRANRKYYKKHGLQDKQLIFAPHAIDNDRFLQITPNDIEKESDMARDIVFMYAGKFEVKKNPFLLLNAFILAELQNANLIMVGNGHLENGLKAKLKEQNFNLQKRIHFMDFKNQSEMPGVYKSCDIFVLPSKGPGETWGLAVNEAMAAGKPVLISDKCGCAEDLVVEGINGYIFKSDSVEDLVQKMKQIISKKGSLVQMGKQSQEIIKNWSFQKICEAIEKAV